MDCLLSLALLGILSRAQLLTMDHYQGLLVMLGWLTMGEQGSCPSSCNPLESHSQPRCPTLATDFALQVRQGEMLVFYI